MFAFLGGLPTVGILASGLHPNQVPDPTDPANLERECGRGLLLMKTFMDEVQFNGNEVLLVKRREVPVSA